MCIIVDFLSQGTRAPEAQSQRLRLRSKMQISQRKEFLIRVRSSGAIKIGNSTLNIQYDILLNLVYV